MTDISIEMMYLQRLDEIKELLSELIRLVKLL